MEAAQFASLCETKDVMRVTKTKVFYMLMEASIRMTINQKPHLSPTLFDQLAEYVEFKVDFHHIYIKAWKDPQQKWFDLPYLATYDAIKETIKN